MRALYVVGINLQLGKGFDVRLVGQQKVLNFSPKNSLKHMLKFALMKLYCPIRYTNLEAQFRKQGTLSINWTIGIYLVNLD